VLDLVVPVQRSTPEVIADALRQAIFRGQLSSGAPLKQNEVARHFRVSAAPVREAFQKLVAEGLAVLHRNRGVVVAPLDVADIFDIAELRALLEAQAIRKSAPHLDAADLARAEAILHEAARADDRGVRANLHWQFHHLLYSKARRPRLLTQIESLFVNMNRYVMPAWDAVWLSERWEDSHLEIVEAIRANDVDRAARLVAEQIHDAAERVVNRLRAKAAAQREADGSDEI
jgi:DNA-binding GntR family transcriptional regulator